MELETLPKDAFVLQRKRGFWRQFFKDCPLDVWVSHASIEGLYGGHLENTTVRASARNYGRTANYNDTKEWVLFSKREVE
jgi:hypothetical protein